MRFTSSSPRHPPVTIYWTLAEAAEYARISPKRLRNLMANGTLHEGTHYTRPRGMRPRFKREAIVSWLEGDSNRPPIPASTPLRAAASAPAIDLALLERVGTHRNGV